MSEQLADNLPYPLGRGAGVRGGAVGDTPVIIPPDFPRPTLSRWERGTGPGLASRAANRSTAGRFAATSPTATRGCSSSASTIPPPPSGSGTSCSPKKTASVKPEADGKRLVGTMKDLGTVPVMAYALDDTVTFYADGGLVEPLP